MYKILQLGDEVQVVFDGDHQQTDDPNSKFLDSTIASPLRRKQKTLGTMSEIQMETSNIAASLIDSVNKATFEQHWRLTQHTGDDEWGRRALTARKAAKKVSAPRPRYSSPLKEKLLSMEGKVEAVEKRLKEGEEEREALKKEVSALNDQMGIAREAYNKLLAHEANKWALIKAQINKGHTQPRGNWDTEQLTTTDTSNTSFI